MPLNPNIILAGRQPDLVNTLNRSNIAAAGSNALRDDNALRQLYQTQGAGIAAGDQNALNALAQLNPQAALGVQNTRQVMDARRQTMAATKQRMDMLNAGEQRAIREHIMNLSAAERQQEAAQIEQGLMRGIQAYQAGDLNGLNALLQSAEIPPLARLEDFPALAARYKGVFDALVELKDFEAPNKPADEYGRYVAEEKAAGRQPLSRIEYAQAKKGKGTIVYDPQTGRPLVSIGGGNDDPTDVTSPSSPAAMIASIDGILNDPALDYSTGILSPLQNIPGTPQKRFGARAQQLEGQAFLQAFESLKGGGHITEIEGQKATQAIGRLDTAQSADDYRAALTELRDILQLGIQRQSGGVTAPAPEPTPAEVPDPSSQFQFETPEQKALFEKYSQ